MTKDSHLSDRELLLAADGELSPRPLERVRRHLTACSTCRKRMADLEITISDFVEAYQADLNREVRPGHAQSALLRRRIAAIGSKPIHGGLLFWKALAVLILVGMFWMWGHWPAINFESSVESGVIPNPTLTPGEATTASKGQVCQAQATAQATRVPDDLREAVFSTYGLKDAPRDAYEVDFLITPELGGSASIRNLWPEPYHRRAWSAHAKDRLEDRLHSLVCSGDLDLATAQHEIASNWVNAYKKYLNTDHPI